MQEVQHPDAPHLSRQFQMRVEKLDSKKRGIVTVIQINSEIQDDISQTQVKRVSWDSRRLASRGFGSDSLRRMVRNKPNFSPAFDQYLNGSIIR